MKFFKWLGKSREKVDIIHSGIACRCQECLSNSYIHTSAIEGSGGFCSISEEHPVIGRSVVGGNYEEPLKYRDYPPLEPEPKPLIIKRNQIMTRDQMEILYPGIKPSPTTFYPPIEEKEGQ